MQDKIFLIVEILSQEYSYVGDDFLRAPVTIRWKNGCVDIDHYP